MDHIPCEFDSLNFLFIYMCIYIYAVLQQRRVIIKNYHGEKLVGILHETGSKELVILCHGLQSSKVVSFYHILIIRLYMDPVMS